MTTVRDIALSAGFLICGLHDYCQQAAIPFGHAETSPSLLSLWGQGGLELIGEVTQYAPLVARLADDLYAVLEGEFPGIWDEEVSEALGYAMAEWMATHPGQAPASDWVKARLVSLAAAWMSDVDRGNWPILRRSLLAVSDRLAADS
jgi:hypothetical protein